MPKRKAIRFETSLETYTEVSHLGEGGAGRVYKVHDTSGHEFALKCLAAERITSDRLKRFKNERNFCRKTDHPGIVKVLDEGYLDVGGTKCPFYVMRCYPTTLRNLVGKLRPEDVLPLFSQILDGVEAAHLMKVWHRDLKPENILYDSSENRAAVADFGIAHFEEEALFTSIVTQPGQRLANVEYCAPEQRKQNQQVDLRSDIFALGMILNELFTGQTPHGSDYKKIASVSPDLAYLDDLVAWMIRQSPDERPESIRLIKKELIGRRNSFVAQQELDRARCKVIKSFDEPDFNHIEPVSFDYKDSKLEITLNQSVPHGWAQEFSSPRGGYSYVDAFTPNRFEIRGNKVELPIRPEPSLVASVVEHAKQYIIAANIGYSQQLKEQRAINEQKERAANELRIKEAEIRHKILSQIQI